MDFTQDFILTILSTLSVTTIKGITMTINIGGEQIFWLIGAIFTAVAAIAGVVYTASKEWGKVTTGLEATKVGMDSLSATIRAIEAAKDDHKTEMQSNKVEVDRKIQALETRVSYISNNFLERMEILETLKRIELFSVSLVQEIQKIINRPINVQAPDLQTPILRRQQDLADQESLRRNRN